MSSSQGYSDRLTPYENKGKLDLQNDPHSPLAVLYKAQYIARRIRHAQHVVVHTGAGISTNSGIPDFRGPVGVWTVQQMNQGQERQNKHKHNHENKDEHAREQEQQEQQEQQFHRESKRRRTCSATPDTKRRDGKAHVSFESALPSLTHAVIAAMLEEKLVHYVISQNVDGLHLRSGLPRDALSELHGNLFLDWCATCAKEFTRDSEATTVGLRPTGRYCPHCASQLTDKALDWDDQLPEPDLTRALFHSDKADLQLVVGTSCQMNPARNLPFRNRCGKQSRILVNLSQTEFDHRFGTVVRADCDSVFAAIARALRLNVPDVTRAARLAVRFERPVQRAGVACSIAQFWDGAWAKRKVPGLLSVEYATRDCDDGANISGYGRLTHAGYDAVVAPTSSVLLYASTECMAPDENGTASRECTGFIFELRGLPMTQEIRLITQVLCCSDKIGRLMGTLELEAFSKHDMRAKDEHWAHQYLVSDNANGRRCLMCVLCNKGVGRGKGAKERHMMDCVQYKLAEKDRNV